MRRGLRRLPATLLGSVAALVLAFHLAAPLPDSSPALRPVPAAASSLTLSSEADCASGAEDGCRAELAVASGWKVPYYSSYPLNGNPDITHAVLVVHGAGRNSASSFTGMSTAAANAGQRDHTVVIAPQFQTSDDDPAADEARWRDEAWKEGGDAEDPPGLSSFDVMDQLIGQLADKKRFPNLSRITLAGHSAGGQFAQRYAAGGRAPAQLRNVQIDYVVANPSSYLYFGPQRPDLSDSNGRRFVTPPGGSCAYDNYKYGLKDRVRYMRDMPVSELIANYTGHRVTYLSGEADNEDDDALDTNCAAEKQGQNRFQRADFYYQYIRTYFPGAPHERVVVPGVGHDRESMFSSPEAQKVIFG